MINCALLWSLSDHHCRVCAFLERQRGGLQEEASRVLHCNIQDWSMSELYFHTGCRLEAHQRDNSYVPPHTLQMSVKAFQKAQVHARAVWHRLGQSTGFLKGNMTKQHRTILKPDVQ